MAHLNIQPNLILMYWNRNYRSKKYEINKFWILNPFDSNSIKLNPFGRMFF